MSYNFGEDPRLTTWVRLARGLLWLDAALVIFNALLVFVSGLLNTDNTQVSFSIGPVSDASGAPLMLLASAALVVGALFIWLPFLLSAPTPTRRYIVAGLAVLLLVLPGALSRSGWLVVIVAAIAAVLLVGEQLSRPDAGEAGAAASAATPPAAAATETPGASTGSASDRTEE